MNSNIMSLQSYPKPARGEPSNNICYYYCICMRCTSSSEGKWAGHVVALVTPLLLCYHQGLDSGPQACMASVFIRGSTSMVQM